MTVADGHAVTTKPHVVRITLSNGLVRVRCHDSLIVQKPDEVFYRVAGVLSVVAGVFALQGATLVADISDGEDSEAGLISFCSRDPDAI